MKFEHLSFEDHMIISNCLSHNKKTIEITQLSACDPNIILVRNQKEPD